MMIKLVAFDAGWVLFRPHNWELLNKKGFTDEEGYWLFREGLGRTSDWIRHQFKKGKSARQVVSVLKKYYPKHANLLNRIQPIIRRLIERDILLNIQLGYQLQKAGYLVEIWSDNGLGAPQKKADYPDSDIGQIPELPLNCPLYKKYPSVRTNLDVPAFYSKDLGIKKENPEFFKKVLQAHPKIKPSEIIFVEDRPKNIYAAKSMGIECIQFVMNGIERNKVKGVPVARTTKELINILHKKGDNMKQLSKEEQIRKCFDFYQKRVLPKVRALATQKKEGYHGLYTHTDAVVFRAIDYALELGQNPMPVIFAAACHDMARTHDFYDEKHGENAVPLAKKVMAKFSGKLTEEEKFSICYAIKKHTTGVQTNDYISACLWDADRTRLAWERGYHEKYFNTEYAKKIASGDSQKYIAWQNKILGRTNKDREVVQTISLEKDLKDIMQMMERLKTHIKQ